MAAHDRDATTEGDRLHGASWSADLEGPAHAESEERVRADAVDAVEHTAPGTHVNLVTHGAHGHPETHLFDHLRDAFGGSVELHYVRQCGCGGRVTRVYVDEGAHARR